MRVVLSTIGKFHSFDLARELHGKGHLEAIFTGYPWFKLRHEELPRSLVRTFPWLHAPYMGFPYKTLLGNRAKRDWEYYDKVTFSRHVARNMPECDVYSGLSSSALEAGRLAKRRGTKYICDRGSSHIRFQDDILREEHDRWGIPYQGIDPRIIGREELEYDLADAITVPSSFNAESFVSLGVRPEKVRQIPYGVNLSRFHKTSDPSPEGFDVLYVGAISLRKGVAYLLDAFQKIQHPRKKLKLVGSFDRRFVNWLRQRNLMSDQVELLGHVPQVLLKHHMSSSHALVLPSIEEGLALVQGQALACGCPVIATMNTGAADLFKDGDAGYIVPIRDTDALADRMQRLADDPDLRRTMGSAALRQASDIGGWSQYGDRMLSLMKELCR